MTEDEFKFEYITSTVSLYEGNGIVIHILNNNNQDENARVVIYRNTGAGAALEEYSGDQKIPSNAYIHHWQGGLGHSIDKDKSGEYWVRIQTTSEFLIPKVSFERLQESKWTPVVNYKPNDFAAFRLKPTRTRIW